MSVTVLTTSQDLHQQQKNIKKKVYLSYWNWNLRIKKTQQISKKNHNTRKLTSTNLNKFTIVSFALDIAVPRWAMWPMGLLLSVLKWDSQALYTRQSTSSQPLMGESDTWFTHQLCQSPHIFCYYFMRSDELMHDSV